MARGEKKLTPLKVSAIKEPGMYGDGLGLWLQVSPTKTKSWVFRFMLNGKSREMGLGSVHTFNITEARERARECRQLLAEGVDPIEARNAKRTQAKLEAAKVMTFNACAEAYITAHRDGWKNAKHVSQWENTLSTYAAPVFGALPVQNIDTSLVMRALEPIWKEKPETASRLRGRIESILDWATVRDFRSGDNPARWKGYLDHLLPSAKAVKHHAALHYSKIGEFMVALRQQEGVSAKALEFLILTAARTNAVIGAKPREFDLEGMVWTIPPARMKGKKDKPKEHRVPLTTQAVSAIKDLLEGEFVFPGRNPAKPISNMAMAELLKNKELSKFKALIKEEDGNTTEEPITVHGFRSSFRDWAAEQTNYPREVAEAALAHVLGDKVEAAYRRRDLFEKRRLMMIDWANYCEKTGTIGEVIPIRKGA